MRHNLADIGRLLAALVLLAAVEQAAAQSPAALPVAPAPEPTAFPASNLPAPPSAAAPAAPPSILGPDTRPIDLDTALRLAHARNPEMMIARERVSFATAQRQLAAAQLLPNINAGTNYDDHTGQLEQSTGEMLNVHRQSLYFGAGAGAVGASTVAIPGIAWNAQLSELYFSNLIARQNVVQQQFNSEATHNNVLLEVAVAYENLLRAEQARAVAIDNRDDTAQVARLTAAYARTGQGRPADADRAATELARRDYDLMDAEGQMLTASARLAQMLSLDAAVRLQTVDHAAVPATIVPDETSLPQLIATAMVQRPELHAQQAAIRQALLALRQQKTLPFTPTVLVGYSAGSFGGGSDLFPPGLGNYEGRSDFDAIAYWSLQNLGVGNLAQIHEAQSRLRTENYQLVRVLDQVRNDVAQAYARTRARYAQIATSEQAIRSAAGAYREDLARIRGHLGLPIEVLDSARLLGQSRSDYVNAIIDYNQAELQLYVALGQPPAVLLALPAPPPAPAALPEPPSAPLPPPRPGA